MLPKAYQTAGFVSSTPLTGESLGIGARFDHYDDKLEETLGNTAYQRVARSTTDAVLRWLGESRDSKRPLFLFVHYIDPHWPYRPPATWASRFSGEPPQPVFVEPLAPVGEDVAHGKANRYDGEVAYLDQEIGRLLQGYADTASIDDALVVLTADHGETMMDGAIWFAHVDVLQPVIHVPLLIRGPGVESGRRMNLVSGIDVVPTVLGFASVEKPDRLPGLDLRKHHPNGERTVFSEAIGLVSTRAAIQGLQKWTLVIDKEGELTNLQRFDLATDPYAVHPLDWRQPPAEAAQALLARTRDDLESETHSTVKIERTLSAAQRERLRQLGYVE
jgi:arylsulfatase A-like enzyme